MLDYRHSQGWPRLVLLRSSSIVGCLLQGEADIVEAVQQAMLAEGVDLELDRAAVRAA